MIKRVGFHVQNDGRKPYKKYSGDAGWDLYVSRPCDIASGETVDVHTDIQLSMPPNTYARITGRSSTLRKHGLLVHEGIIDNGYTGEMFVCVHNLGKETFHVKPGMRLAQVIFGTIETIEWVELEKIESDPAERGDAGFGSTGR